MADKLVARDTDINSHGAGNIIAVVQNCTVNDLRISTVIDPAKPDNKSHPPSATKTKTGTPKVTANDRIVHRQDDFRYCGAVTATYSHNTLAGD